MRSMAMFNFDYLFGDHFANVSDEAKLLYIKLMFFATDGFVANPLSVLDSMGYDRSVIDELIINGDLLKLENRSEVFITAYYIHNHNFSHSGWAKTPFSEYWKGKLWIKDNGVATFKASAVCHPKVQERISTDSKGWSELLDSIDDGGVSNA